MKAGSWNWTFSALQGFDFQGSHLEDRGLSPDLQVIEVPLHRHEVSLDFTQFQVEASYAIDPSWDAWFRVPFAIKDQTVVVSAVAPADADEINAMVLNGQIHHRDETYSGLHDPSILVAHRRSGILREGDVLTVALGSSLPVGATEEDPYELGDAGVEHLHIQFGTGTFDPLLEAFYDVRLGSTVSVTGFLQSKASVYENGNGYRGSPEINAGGTLARQIHPRLKLRTNYTYFRQGWAHWQGVRDENSGLSTHYVGIGTAFSASSGVGIELDLRWPFAQSVLTDDSDAFDQGISMRAGVAWGGR